MKALCVLCCSAVSNSFTTEQQRTQSKDADAVIDARLGRIYFLGRCSRWLLALGLSPRPLRGDLNGL